MMVVYLFKKLPKKKKEKVEEEKKEEIKEEVEKEKKDVATVASPNIIDSFLISEELSAEKLEELIEKAKSKLMLAKLKDEERAKKQELLKKVEKYKEDGYNVNMLEKVMDRDLVIIENAMKNFEENIKYMKTFTERVDKLDSFYKDEIEEIRKKMKDPAFADEIEKSITIVEEKIKNKRQDLLDKLEIYRYDGWRVNKLENVLDSNLGEIVKEFEIFENNIDDFNKFIERITMFEGISPKKLEEHIEKAKSILILLKEEEEAKKQEILKKIEKYRDEGYNVNKLENVIDRDLETIENAMKNFEENIKYLKTLKERVDKLDSFYKDEIEEIRKKMKDPAFADEIERSITSIEEKVENKRKEILDKLEKYREEGYNIRRLENFLDSNLEKIVKEFEIFENDIDLLKRFGERVSKISSDYPDETKKIVEKLKDPDAVPEIESMLASIGKKDDYVKKIFKKKIEQWRVDGWVVEGLEKVLKEDKSTIEEAFKSFEEGIHELGNIEIKLKPLEKLYSSEVAAIRVMLNNPENIPMIEKSIHRLEEKVEERRNIIKEKLEDYRRFGYVTKRIDSIISNKDISLIEKEFAGFEADITRLKKLESKIEIGKIDKKYEKEIASIKSKMNNPDLISEISGEYLELVKKIDLDKAKKKAIKDMKYELELRILTLEETILGLKEKGLNIEPVKNTAMLARSFLTKGDYEKVDNYIKEAEKIISKLKIEE